jgi:hypothetical protein
MAEPTCLYRSPSEPDAPPCPETARWRLALGQGPALCCTGHLEARRRDYPGCTYVPLERPGDALLALDGPARRHASWLLRALAHAQPVNPGAVRTVAEELAAAHTQLAERAGATTEIGQALAEVAKLYAGIAQQAGGSDG